MSYRGLNTAVTQIRREVFTEVARMAYDKVQGENADLRMKQIPFKIVPGEEGKYRKDIFLERAIVQERMRLAMGLPTRRVDEFNSVSEGLDHAAIAEKYYDPPLINVIKFACNRCPEKMVKISDLCQGCLAHPCMEVCPKNAISWVSGRSVIDQEKCIKCGKCVDVCPYHAVVKTERPCAAACGMDAIHTDSMGRANIDYAKCVSCGQCLVNCPFGAIADKGQILQLINSFNRGDKVYALMAPAFINQFPELTKTGRLKAALKAVGFADVVEVAIGADLCTVDEAKDFLEKVPKELDFMATSCCPAWSMMAKTAFPDVAKNISMTMTPMVFTARMIKKAHPDARICFVGPCAAKKLEASRRHVRSHVDFVLTFEELSGIIEAKGIEVEMLEADEAEAAMNEASGAGRNYAQTGGVAQAVANKIHDWYPDKEVKIASAQTLPDCKKMLMLAKAGKYKGYLLEGMGCPGGCIGGAGTIADPKKTAVQLSKYVAEAPFKDPEQSSYIDNLHILKDDPNFE
ncbi:MAG: 4Fe-4S dicluster domain-containing protein [Anaerovibrio sp.]|nr:4Fe-4S dicluster domain-containing protein [Anaerovibrio sp.]